MPKAPHGTVRTGKPEGRVNDRATGEEFFAEFVQDLFPLSYPAVNTLGQYLNLKEATSQVRVLDVATGSGVWGIALAQQSEHVKVSAVNWPIVLEVTRQMTARFGLTNRAAVRIRVKYTQIIESTPNPRK